MQCSTLLFLFATILHAECMLQSQQKTTLGVSPSIQLSVNSYTGTYTIYVNNTEWFTSGPTAVYFDGAWSTTEDGSLKQQTHGFYSGYDTWGLFGATEIAWVTKGGELFYTVFKIYYDEPAIVFEQRFPDGASNTSVQGSLMSSFPTLNITDVQSGQYGYLTYSGNSRWN